MQIHAKTVFKFLCHSFMRIFLVRPSHWLGPTHKKSTARSVATLVFHRGDKLRCHSNLAIMKHFLILTGIASRFIKFLQYKQRGTNRRHKVLKTYNIVSCVIDDQTLEPLNTESVSFFFLAIDYDV